MPGTPVPLPGRNTHATRTPRDSLLFLNFAAKPPSGEESCDSWLSSKRAKCRCTKVRLAAVANDDVETFGEVFDRVFADKMADHIDTIAGMGRQYFGPDKAVKSSLDRSARRAAWRMIRREEIVDE